MLTGLVLLVVGGTAGALYYQGFFDEQLAEKGPDRTGQRAAVVVYRNVPAFTKIRTEHLVLPDGRPSVMWLKKETVDEKKASGEWLVTPADVVGRVLKRDKRPGLIFTPSDFYPEGTREGIAAGIPPGKKAITVQTSKIRGLDLLRQGDSFDLFVSLPLSKRDTSQPVAEYGVLVGGVKPPDLRATQIGRQSGVKLVVKQGEMITLTKGRQQSTQGAQTLTPDSSDNRRRQTTTETMATIAVGPLEVLPLMRALSLDKADDTDRRNADQNEIDLFCVVRSGRGDEDDEEFELEKSVEGMVAVPAPYRPVDVYSPITLDDLMDPVTGKLNVYYFPPERIDDRWINNPVELVGRVANVSLPPGYLITEEDLLPPGTIPGITAGVPDGMVATTVPIAGINGLNRLRSGDRFEIRSSLPVEPTTLPPAVEWVDLQGGEPDRQSQELIDELRSGIKVIVEDAEFVKTLDEGSEVAIAISPEAITPLMEALNAKVSLAIFLKTRGGFGNEVVDGSAKSTVEGVTPTVRRASVIPVSQNTANDQQRVGVPVIARPIAAYSEITLDDFKEPATGKIRMYYFPASKVGKSWVQDVNALIGRVARKDLKPGYVVFEDQLFPQGTRPGPTAGVPPGMRSMLLTSDNVEGLTAFKQGDRIELVAARPFNVGQIGQTQVGLDNGDPEADAAAGPFNRADVSVIATDAVIVTRGDPEERSFTLSQPQNKVEETKFGGAVLTQSTTTSQELKTITRIVTDFTLALTADEVTLVSEALATNAKIYAVARSGNSEPSATPDPIKPNQPFKDVKLIETVRNGEASRQVWIDGNSHANQRKASTE